MDIPTFSNVVVMLNVELPVDFLMSIFLADDGLKFLYTQEGADIVLTLADGTERVAMVNPDDAAKIIPWLEKGAFFTVSKDGFDRETNTIDFGFFILEQELVKLTVEFEPIKGSPHGARKTVKKTRKVPKNVLLDA